MGRMSTGEVVRFTLNDLTGMVTDEKLGLLMVANAELPTDLPDIAAMVYGAIDDGEHLYAVLTTQNGPSLRYIEDHEAGLDAFVAEYLRVRDSEPEGTVTVNFFALDNAEHAQAQAVMTQES